MRVIHKLVVTFSTVVGFAVLPCGCDRSETAADAPIPSKKEGEPKAANQGWRDLEFDGKAVRLADVIHHDLRLELVDPAFDGVVAFQTDNGRLIPILPTESGLFFYRDDKVRGRRMRVRARMFEGFDAIEIVDRFSHVDGKWNEIYYWCEICSIKMHHLKQCECCQGPVELREHPVGEAFEPRNK